MVAWYGGWGGGAGGCCSNDRCSHGGSPHGHSPRRTWAVPAPMTPTTARPPEPRRPQGLRPCVVAVIDTGVAEDSYAIGMPGGVLPPNAPGQPPVTTFVWRRPGADNDIADDDGDNYIDPFAGHGTFIAGIISRIAPDAQIVAHRAMPGAGDVDDFHVALSILHLLIRLGRPEALAVRDELVALGDTEITAVDSDLIEMRDLELVINLSFSGYAEDDDPPLCTQAVVSRLLGPVFSQPGQAYELLNEQNQDVVLVASAGNDGDCRVVWPGGFDDVVCVGALAGSRPAWFSNYGNWVNSCAQGSDVISLFFVAPDPTAPLYSDLAAYSGWAAWSGTSFSAPVVAAAIAQEAMTVSENVRSSVERLIEQPELFRYPWLGTVINSY